MKENIGVYYGADKGSGGGAEKNDPFQGRLTQENFKAAADAGLIETAKPRDWRKHMKQQEKFRQSQENSTRCSDKGGK